MAFARRDDTVRRPDAPVLIVHLEGWVDAGVAGATAMAAVLESGPTELVATFDGDSLVDYRDRRPVVRIAEGINEGLTWREPKLLLGADRSGRDVLLLIGPEPDFHWRAFCAEVAGIAVELGATLMVGLGAFPAAVPHTRQVRLACTATDPALAARVGYIGGTIDVPAGCEAALELAMSEAGVPAAGLWARVPHYVAALPYPFASAALLNGLGEVAGLQFDTAPLVNAGEVAVQRVDQLIANSAEHQAMVRKLEHTVDEAEGTPLGDLPTGDEIAAELERFLRGQGH
ncbi:MAG TPA: PAC2 family protein [Acidimicrobiales bacterium]|nr:PAC2 family protein [Acidimicrobiales bacterium]